VKRGELWTVSGGIYAQNPCPALIIQDDLFEASESVTLLPLTSHLTDAPILRLTVEPGDLTGLERESQIMVDKLTTVRRTSLGQRVGQVDAKIMAAVEQSLAVFLGLGG